MSTAADIIKDALRQIGAIASGETPAASEQADGLRSLNRMIDAWSIDGLLIYETKIESFPLVPAQSSYTFGATGDFDSARPISISMAKIQTNGFETPVRIISLEEWAHISIKNVPGSYPTKIFLSGSFPLETINVWPIPDQVSDLILYSKKPLAQFATVSDDVILPVGYEDSLIDNLSVRLAGEYGKQLDPILADRAIKSKARLKSKNIKPVMMRSDTAGVTGNSQSFNIITGE